jgi:2-isopropylmalate synthase
MHIDAVNKNTISFEHIAPEKVGNTRRILMSEVSGRSTVLAIINKVDATIKRDSPETLKILNLIKQLEFNGYQFEGAEHSLELIVRKELGKFKHSFELLDCKVISENRGENASSSLAFIKINVVNVVAFLNVST